MDFELRTVLLIIGVVVIAAILIHGLIGIRKANKPVDISHLDLTETDNDGNLIRDGGGFDRHGVGVARVKPGLEGEEFAATASVSDNQTDVDKFGLNVGVDTQDSGPSLSGSTIAAEPMSDGAINFDVALDGGAGPSDETLDTPNVQLVDKPDDSIKQSPNPVFASPVVQEKQDYLAVKEPSKTDQQQETHVELPQDNERVAEPAKTTVAEPMDVLVLNVVAGDEQELSGAVLLQTLLTLGFKFGDMDIFHRHEQASGQGDVLFSLVNMVKPGTFDIDNIEQFTTTGISLFMTIPHQHGNMETFNTMLNAAAKIAEAFDGQVLDGDRSTLTNQSTQHYVQRIREVERKMLLVK